MVKTGAGGRWEPFALNFGLNGRQESEKQAKHLGEKFLPCMLKTPNKFPLHGHLRKTASKHVKKHIMFLPLVKDPLLKLVGWDFTHELTCDDGGLGGPGSLVFSTGTISGFATASTCSQTHSQDHQNHYWDN